MVEPIFKKGDYIINRNSSDMAILVLHGGGFGYKTAPSQLLNACQYASRLHCRAYLPDYHLLPEYPFPTLLIASGSSASE